MRCWPHACRTGSSGAQSCRALLASTAGNVSTIGSLPLSRARASRAKVRPLLGVARPVAQRQQRAIAVVAIKDREGRFLDQAAGFDQATGKGVAPEGLELGFLFGKPDFSVVHGHEGAQQANGPRGFNPMIFLQQRLSSFAIMATRSKRLSACASLCSALPSSCL